VDRRVLIAPDRSTPFSLQGQALDVHLDMVAMDDLFGRSAEKIGELIVARICER